MEKGTFRNKLTEVAGLLNMTAVWSPPRETAEEFTDNRGYLIQAPNERQPFALTLFVANGGWKAEGRIVVKGEFPRGPKGEFMAYDVKEVSEITVNESKTPEQIAKDIERRLLPGYLRALPDVLRRVKEATDYLTERDAEIQKVARYLRVKVNAERDRPFLWIRYGRAVRNIEAYSRDRVKFDVECSGEVAVKVLAVLEGAGVLYDAGKGPDNEDN